MFNFRDDNAMMRPPAVVTMGQLKKQFEEPDWCHPPQQQYVESRDQIWTGYDRGGNSLVNEERDIRMPMNNYPYPPPQQQFMASREAASYMAAIKAVDDSLYTDGRGSITVLRGLWKVFDSVVSELGTELTASLANKAVYEANVMQENFLRQGRNITSLEKKSNALSRKKHYEAELKSTMLRLRGTFADVILGTKKELQKSIDKSFAVQTDDMKASFAKTLAETETKLEQKYTKKAIDAEYSFATQLKERDSLFAKTKADMLHSFAKKKEELQISLASILESNKASTDMMQAQMNQKLETSNMELARLQNELRQAQAQSREFDLAKNMAQNQLSQETERLHHVEKKRDEAVSKLSSTLQTLEATCISAQGLETRLREKEVRLHEMEERLQYVEQERRTVQHELDNEVKNKSALINVQQEMEKHLNLEGERADLLQQKLEQLGGELDRASQENMQLKSELERWGEDNMHLKSENDRISQHLQIANEVCSTLKTNLTALETKFEEQVQVSQASMAECTKLERECQEFKVKVDNISEINSLLESKVERLVAKIEDQVMDLEAARMSEAEVEKSLAESLHNGRELDRLAQNLEADLRKVYHERAEMAAALEEKVSEIEALKIKSNEDEHAYIRGREEIAAALTGFDAEMSSAEEKLNSVLQSNADLESEVASLKAQLENEKQEESIKLDNAQIVIETLQDEARQLAQTFKEKEATLKKNMNDEISNLEDQFVKVNDEHNKQLSKYEADIGVYEEAIQMLRHQVGILQSLADAQCDQREKCVEMAEDEESNIERPTDELEAIKDKLKMMTSVSSDGEELKDGMQGESEGELKEGLREEARQGSSLSISPEILKEDVEKCSSSNAEKLSVHARENLVQKIEQSTSLERSEDQSTQYIHASNQSNESIHEEGADIIETVAKSRHSSGKISSEELDHDHISTVNAYDNVTSRDLGRDLDILLADIEAKLGVER